MEKDGIICVQKDKERCAVCNARVKNIHFKCRCGIAYCRQHISAEAHECTFDYKQHGRSHIAIQNPKITASKMDSI